MSSSIPDVVGSMRTLATRMQHNEYSRREAVLEQSKTKEEIDRVIYNHAISHQELSHICGLSINTMKEKYAKAFEQGIIEPAVKVKINGNIHQIIRTV